MNPTTQTDSDQTLRITSAAGSRMLTLNHRLPDGTGRALQLAHVSQRMMKGLESANAVHCRLEFQCLIAAE